MADTSNEDVWPVSAADAVALGKRLEDADPAAAYGLYAAAARRGDAEGAFLAGKDRFYGIAHPVDDAKSEAFLRMAAENASAPDAVRADAFDSLGLLFLRRKQTARARKYFTRASSFGSLDSLDNLGKMARDAGDPDKALGYFSRADKDARERAAGASPAERDRIDLDAAWARLHLASFLPWWHGDSDSSAKEARRLLADVERLQDVFLWKDIGDAYLDSEFEAADPDAAETWYRRSAEGGFADAQVALARFLLSRKKTPEAAVEAVDWLGKACAKGSSEAFRLRAECYARGDGVPQNWSRATVEYRLAADCAGPGQDDWIDEAYRDGRFGWRHGEDVLAWIRARADSGAVWALRLCVGETMREEDPDAFWRFLAAAAEKGVPSAQFERARELLFASDAPAAAAMFRAFLDNPDDKDAETVSLAKKWLAHLER
ncbi:MAG: sel1 repeat family protein [Kiritimatiellae bacterium]|nr:sel1 repeat family protein [Kiritimatiellia bacterium]